MDYKEPSAGSRTIPQFQNQEDQIRANGIKALPSKGYDRVNWTFLKTVLPKFGFYDVFVIWTLDCVTLVSFEVLVNGGKSAQFKSTRGLRQGDPLSPYLFIISQEILLRIIEHQLAIKNLDRVKSSINAQAIMHVMYANDIVLFSIH